jgi:hypothetical protein
VDELHQRLIALGLEAASDLGFALAGGYAVQAHRIVTRISDDVDLFTTMEHQEEFATAVERVVSAYRQAGLTVEVSGEGDYASLVVTDPSGDPERVTKVELAIDFRVNPPVSMSVGPVLHRDDMAAGKVGALFGRAAARDYIDVAALVLGGHYTREELLRLAEERDSGFDRAVFAQMLAGIARYKDIDFLRYGIDQRFLEAVRHEVEAWQRELSAEPADEPGR